jgi:hypothetical protein
MIYLDPSVVLAELFAEDRRAPDAVWSDPLITSRLTEYEVWTRVNARGVTASHGEAVRGIFTRLSFVELARPVLSRALEPFPVPVRTLEALHLATLVYLRDARQDVTLATFDARMTAAARKLKVPLAFHAVEE